MEDAAKFPKLFPKLNFTTRSKTECPYSQSLLFDHYKYYFVALQISTKHFLLNSIHKAAETNFY